MTMVMMMIGAAVAVSALACEAIVRLIVRIGHAEPLPVSIITDNATTRSVAVKGVPVVGVVAN